MVTLFDHYSNQTHDSVAIFLSNWGERPWDDANVPVNLHLSQHGGVYEADVLVFHPRKEHVKHVVIRIESNEALERLRATFVGIAEGLYAPAASVLEAFGRGDMPIPDEEEPEWGGIVLYYWHSTEMVKPEQEEVITSP